MKVVISNFLDGKCISTTEISTLESFLEFSKQCNPEERSAIGRLLSLPPEEDWTFVHTEVFGGVTLACIVGRIPYNPFYPTTPEDFLEEVRRMGSQQK